MPLRLLCSARRRFTSCFHDGCGAGALGIVLQTSKSLLRPSLGQHADPVCCSMTDALETAAGVYFLATPGIDVTPGAPAPALSFAMLALVLDASSHFRVYHGDDPLSLATCRADVNQCVTSLAGALELHERCLQRAGGAASRGSRPGSFAPGAAGACSGE